MAADSEGFRYPVFVDSAACIKCGLCEDSCPVRHQTFLPERHQAAPVVAAVNRDEAVRLDSTSGGVFSALAVDIFRRGGYVGGAVYQSDHSVKHILTNDPERLADLRSSKYLESRFEDIFPEAEKLLRAGELVFIAGAPCQIAALYSYLRKDYDNLLTCDFICLGVPSPKVFQKYMQQREKSAGARATLIKFKDKTFGWHNFAMRIEFANQQRYCVDRSRDPFFVGYLQYKNFSRPSCYDCRFKERHCADITVGDFWGIEKLAPEMDQDRGTSLMMLNSARGEAALSRIEADLHCKKMAAADIDGGNRAWKNSIAPKGGNRKKFFAALDKYDFDRVAATYFPLKGRARFFRRLRSLKKLVKFIRFGGINFPAWYAFIRYNFLAGKKVRKDEPVRLLPRPGSRIWINRKARLVLAGDLSMTVQQCPGAKLESRVLLENESSWRVMGNFAMYAGSFVRVLKKGVLTTNSGFINENVQIICGERITIGDDCNIGRDAIIRDYDGHCIDSAENISAPITIGSHVWIGQRAIILKGVTIGDGAVVAAGAIVTGDVPARTLVAGVPARVIRENVNWQ